MQAAATNDSSTATHSDFKEAWHESDEKKAKLDPGLAVRLTTCMPAFVLCLLLCMLEVRLCRLEVRANHERSLASCSAGA